MLLLATVLFSACSSTQDTELSFDEQAELDQVEAEEHMAEQEAQAAADEAKFATMQPTDEDGDGYKTFVDSENSITFDFPADWIFELSREGEGYRVDLNNEVPMDGCTATSAALVFTYPMQKDSSLSFEDFVKSPGMYDVNGGLGQLGGELTEMTIAGSQAFRAEYTGYETFHCEDDAYLVEIDSDEYLFIGAFTGTLGNEADEIKKILNSIRL